MSVIVMLFRKSVIHIRFSVYSVVALFLTKERFSLCPLCLCGEILFSFLLSGYLLKMKAFNFLNICDHLWMLFLICAWAV